MIPNAWTHRSRDRTRNKIYINQAASNDISPMRERRMLPEHFRLTMPFRSMRCLWAEVCIRSDRTCICAYFVLSDRSEKKFTNFPIYSCYEPGLVPISRIFRSASTAEHVSRGHGASPYLGGPFNVSAFSGLCSTGKGRCHKMPLGHVRLAINTQQSLLFSFCSCIR